MYGDIATVSNVWMRNRERRTIVQPTSPNRGQYLTQSTQPLSLTSVNDRDNYVPMTLAVALRYR